MRHKLIKSIKTRIRKKRQFVIIEFDNKEFVFLAASNIKQNTGLEVFELELLIGSKLRIDFYIKGEQMFNGKVCEKENVLVKEYFFELQKPVDSLRIENKNQLLPFKKIKQIFYFNKFNKESVGIKTENDNVTFISLKRFEIQSNLDRSEQHILGSSYIYPEYYKVGEKLSNGKDVTENNKLLKWINLRYSDNIERMHQNFENSMVYFDGAEYYDSSDDGPGAYGYSSWDDMAFNEAFDGDVDSWDHYNQ